MKTEANLDLLQGQVDLIVTVVVPDDDKLSPLVGCHHIGHLQPLQAYTLNTLFPTIQQPPSQSTDSQIFPIDSRAGVHTPAHQGVREACRERPTWTRGPLYTIRPQ